MLQRKSKDVEEKVVLDTDYADDMAILDNSRDGLQDLLAHYCSYAGLRIKAKKTQCMAISRGLPGPHILGAIIFSRRLRMSMLRKSVISECTLVQLSGVMEPLTGILIS